jgi:hypothetical protein
MLKKYATAQYFFPLNLTCESVNNIYFSMLGGIHGEKIPNKFLDTSPFSIEKRSRCFTPLWLSKTAVDFIFSEMMK